MFLKTFHFFNFLQHWSKIGNEKNAVIHKSQKNYTFKVIHVSHFQGYLQHVCQRRCHNVKYVNKYQYWDLLFGETIIDHHREAIPASSCLDFMFHFAGFPDRLLGLSVR